MQTIDARKKANTALTSLDGMVIKESKAVITTMAGASAALDDGPASAAANNFGRGYASQTGVGAGAGAGAGASDTGVEVAGAGTTKPTAEQARAIIEANRVAKTKSAEELRLEKRHLAAEVADTRIHPEIEVFRDEARGAGSTLVRAVSEDFDIGLVVTSASGIVDKETSDKKPKSPSL
jgi:hypothetical protein